MLLEQELAMHDITHNSCHDYALFIRDLPGDTTKEELLEHFEKLVIPASNSFEIASARWWNKCGDYVEAHWFCLTATADQWDKTAAEVQRVAFGGSESASHGNCLKATVHPQSELHATVQAHPTMNVELNELATITQPNSQTSTDPKYDSRLPPLRRRTSG